MAAVQVPLVTISFLRCCWYLMSWFIWQRARGRVRCLPAELSKDATPPAVFIKTAALLLVSVVTALLGLFFAWCWLLTMLSVIALVRTYREESKLADVLSARYDRTRMRLHSGSFYVVETGF